MKKTIKLSNGKVIKLTIIEEYDGNRTVLTDKEISEEEADEIAERI